MKQSRAPYGKSAQAFTDGFTLTFETAAPDSIDMQRPHILRFEPDWLSHFAAHSSPTPSIFSSPRYRQR
ncbi:MAG TPA: hypothetical protein VFB54_02910 [Burkholderiales bacterium]|nr:hypothetical protein [Burkholderiales bacterium]